MTKMSKTFKRIIGGCKQSELAYSQGETLSKTRNAMYLIIFEPMHCVDEAIYAFLASQHIRLGQYSPARMLPECCCKHIAEYAEDSVERIAQARSCPQAIIRLITNK